MSKTIRHFPKIGTRAPAPRSPKPQPRDKSCKTKDQLMAQNYRQELDIYRYWVAA